VTDHRQLRGKREYTPGRSSRASEEGMDLAVAAGATLAVVLGCGPGAGALVAVVSWAWRALRPESS